jgi:hypothetical protein
MSIALFDLIARLELAVPSASGLPTAAQYEDAVIEGVADFSRRCPSTRMTTLNITANVAEYALPADFVRIVQFPNVRQLSSSGVMVTGSGLVPLSMNFSERHSIRNKKLTLFPTPQYSMERPIYYAGGYPLEGTAPNQAFTDLSDDDASIALHKATELLLMVIAAGVARDGWNYSLVDMSVSKSGLPQAIREQAKGERELYELAIAARAGGTQTLQADYATSEYGSFSGDV